MPYPVYLQGRRRWYPVSNRQVGPQSVASIQTLDHPVSVLPAILTELSVP